VDGIKRDPFGRRHIVTAWNPDDLSSQKLPCCHCFFQCYVNDQKELSLVLHQRSADMFLGVPFNIASYALLTMMLAQVTGNTPGMFIHNFGDAHIYLSHREAVKTQLGRMPRRSPTMKLDPKVDNLFAFDHTSFTLEGYDPHEAIKAPVAV
jgi:thymidylate synthase